MSADWFASLQTIDGPIAPGNSSYQQAAQVEHSWVVQLSDGALAELENVSQLPAVFEAAQLPVRPLRGLGLAGQMVVEGFVDPTTTEAALRASTLIAHVSRNGVMQGQRSVPNDPKFSQQTGLDQLSDLDIDAPEAWDTSKGSRSVVVAVIDSGVDYLHPDLKNNVWTNTGEIAGNGIDDDRNGFIDDVRGYDFANGDSTPLDDNGHGTSVAGILGAQGNNGIGISGVNWATSMVALKFLDQNNVGTRDNAVAAINYATMLRNSGVNLQVINASWGDYGDFYQPLFDAIKTAGDAGILFVAASGNGNSLGRGIDLDRERTAFYPASYDLGNIVSVGALGKDGQIASFSNYGVKSVDLLAPGEGILTTDRSGQYTDPNNAYAQRNGTSFAAPFVSGAAALIAAAKPDTPISEIRDALLTGVQQNPVLSSIAATSGVLNAKGALTAKTFAPRATVAAVSNVTAANTFTVNVTYTSDVDLVPESIEGKEIQINRVGFQGKAQNATLLSKNDSDKKRITATYQFTVTGSIENGSYEIVVLGNRVRNVNGLATAQRAIAKFNVAIADPNIIAVNSTADVPLARVAANQMTLRAAIQKANATAGDQTILLPDGIYKLVQGGSFARGEDAAVKGDLDITSNGKVTILGSGSAFNSIDAIGQDRVFDVLTSAQLDLSDITITGGSESIGGGIRNAGVLIVDRSTIQQSVAATSGGGIASLVASTTELRDSTIDGNVTTNRLTPLGGAGVFNAGELSISGSTFSNNTSAAGFTTVGGGGAVFNDQGGSLELTRSTLSGNSAAQGRGGGLYNAGSATIDRATIVNNRAVRAGGVFNASGAVVSARGSVIANSLGAVNDADGAFTSRGYNFIGLASLSTTGFSTGTNDIIVPESGTPLDPQLGLLADNGGLTKTHLPETDSPLIDGIEDDFSSLDQLGRTVSPGGTFRAEIGSLERVDSIISGRIFRDLNGDGLFGLSEAGLADVTVYVDVNGNSILDQGEPSTSTVADDPATPTVVETGNYRFIVPPFTNFPVSIVTPAGFSPTSFRSLPVSSSVTLTKLADSLTGINGSSATSFSNPVATAVDADGTVAFVATSSSGQVSFYIGKDDSFATVAVGGNVSYYDNQMENGRLTFVSAGGVFPVGAYLRESDGTVQVLANTNTPIPNASGTFAGLNFFEPRISNGIVLFHTEKPSSPANQGAVYASSESGNLFRVDDLSGTQDRGDRFFDADIDAYNFTFVTPMGIFLRMDNSGTALYVSQGANIPGGGQFDFNQPSALAMSNGVVSFLAHGNSGQWGVYRRKFSVETLADLNTVIPGTTQNFTGFGSELSSEGLNTVFLGHGAAEFRGIYASIDGKLRKIVDTNDQVQGSKIMSLDLGSDALSGNHIGFTATLADRRQVVMLATVPFVSQQPINFNFAGEELRDKNFGLQALPGTIRGNVFEDIDTDTVPDATDTPLQNWTVFIDQNDNKSLDASERSVCTNAQGDYVFNNLPASQTYNVRLQVQSNYNRIFPTNADDGKWVVALNPGETRTSLDFATVKSDGSGGVGTASKLQGRIYDDVNKNKKFDTGDTPRVGWTVFVDLNNNGFLDSGERRTTTGTGGVYQMGNLASGTYSVRALVPSDSEQVTPLSNTLTQRSQLSTVTNPTSLTLGVLHTVQAGEPANPALDLAILSKANNSLQILKNNGNGAFTTRLTLSGVGNSPTVVRTGDIDNDGHTDLIVGNGSDYGLSVLYHKPGTTGIPYALVDRFKFGLAGKGFNQKTSDLVVADFDGKGGDDIATANYRQSGAVSIFLNAEASKSTLRLTQSLDAGGFAGAIAAGDLDGDGDLDLVVSNLLDATLRLLRNDGKGVFTQFGGTLAVGAAPASIAVGNFDGDKWPNGKPKLDLAVANYGSVKVSILRATGSFTFAPAVSLAVPSGAASVVMDDIDGDGDKDLIVAAGSDRASGGISLLRNRGNGVFGAAESQAVGLLTGINTFNVAVGKVDSNGSLDLVVTDGFNSQYSVLTNTILSQGNHQVNLLTGLETVSGLDFLVKQQATAAPTAVDLLPSSDSGTSNIDNLTRLNNSAGKKLQFRVDGTLPGAVVRLFAGSTLIGSATASGKTTFITTNGSALLANGVRSITAKQQLPGTAQSAASASLNVTIDTVAPAAPSKPDLIAQSDNGSSNTDNSTSLTTLTFAGTTTAGSTLRMFRDGVQIAMVLNSAASYLQTFAGFTQGTHVLSANASDKAGNFSPLSASLSFKVVAPSSAAVAAALASSPYAPAKPRAPTTPDSPAQDDYFAKLVEEQE